MSKLIPYSPYLHSRTLHRDLYGWFRCSRWTWEQDLSGFEGAQTVSSSCNLGFNWLIESVNATANRAYSSVYSWLPIVVFHRPSLGVVLTMVDLRLGVYNDWDPTHGIFWGYVLYGASQLGKYSYWLFTLNVYGPVCMKLCIIEGLYVFNFLVDSHNLSSTVKVISLLPVYFVGHSWDSILLFWGILWVSATPAVNESTCTCEPKLGSFGGWNCIAWW